MFSAIYIKAFSLIICFFAITTGYYRHHVAKVTRKRTIELKNWFNFFAQIKPDSTEEILRMLKEQNSQLANVSHQMTGLNHTLTG